MFLSSSFTLVRSTKILGNKNFTHEEFHFHVLFSWWFSVQFLTSTKTKMEPLYIFFFFFLLSFCVVTWVNSMPFIPLMFPRGSGSHLKNLRVEVWALSRPERIHSLGNFRLLHIAANVNNSSHLSLYMPKVKNPKIDVPFNSLTRPQGWGFISNKISMCLIITFKSYFLLLKAKRLCLAKPFFLYK